MESTAALTAPDDVVTLDKLWPAWAAVVLALLGIAAELIAGPGYRLGWWGLGPGLQLIRWAAITALAAGLIGAALAFLGGRRTRPIGFAALLIGFAGAAPPAWFYYQLQHLPKLHDISTDTDNPPQFVAALPLRSSAHNAPTYDPTTADAQRRGYPDIGPMALDEPPAQALERAAIAARSMGWDIVAIDPQALRIEATATSLLFGFKDDVVIRIAPRGGGSRIDVRSQSRVGGSDFGANAKRIHSFMQQIASSAP